MIVAVVVVVVVGIIITIIITTIIIIITIIATIIIIVIIIIIIITERSRLERSAPAVLQMVKQTRGGFPEPFVVVSALLWLPPQP